MINTGVVGYNSSHGVRQLTTQILQLEPDVLTVRFGFNDHAFSGAVTDVRDPDNSVLRFLYYQAQHLRLFRLALAGYRRPVGPPAVSVALFEKNLRRFAALAQGKRIGLLLIDYPLRPFESGIVPGEALPFLGGARTLEELHERHQMYQDALREVATQEGLQLIETRRELSRPETAAYSSADLAHPNPRGAALIARRIADRLEMLGWVGERSHR